MANTDGPHSSDESARRNQSPSSEGEGTVVLFDVPAVTIKHLSYSTAQLIEFNESVWEMDVREVIAREDEMDMQEVAFRLKSPVQSHAEYEAALAELLGAIANAIAA